MTLTEKQKAAVLRQERKDSIEFLGLMADDLHEPTEAMQDSITVVLNYITELEALVDYLEFFHKNADFGPAHTDVVMAIQAQYEATGKTVPATWKYE